MKVKSLQNKHGITKDKLYDVLSQRTDTDFGYTYYYKILNDLGNRAEYYTSRFEIMKDNNICPACGKVHSEN